MSEILVRLLRFSYERLAFSFFKENEEKTNMNIADPVKRNLTLRNVFTKDIEVHEVKKWHSEMMEDNFTNTSIKLSIFIELLIFSKFWFSQCSLKSKMTLMKFSFFLSYVLFKSISKVMLRANTEDTIVVISDKVKK